MALRAKKNINIPVVGYEYCPAKTYQDQQGVVRLGRTVFNHCQIVGEVAKELINRSAVAHLFPKGSAFTAATHDIGKVSPTFYNKLYAACGLTKLPSIDPALESLPHARGGVSGFGRSGMAAIGSSPRPWGCF